MLASSDPAAVAYAAWIGEMLCEKFKYSVHKFPDGSRWIDTGPEAVNVTELAELLATEADWRVAVWGSVPTRLQG